MSVASVSSNSQASGAVGAKTTSVLAMPEIDSGAFMKMLLAQLRHQNPLEPMDDKEMIGQMTQLNSLQELQKINSTLQTLVDITRSEDPKEGSGNDTGSGS